MRYKGIFRKLARILLWTIAVILSLLLVLTVVFSFPSVQTAAAKKLVTYVNEEYELDARLSSLQYVFPDELILEEVYLPDHQGDTLLYTGHLDVKIAGYAKLFNRLGIRAIEVDKGRFYLHTKRGEKRSNLSIFLEKFSSSDTTSSEAFRMIIQDIELANTRFWLEDFNCDSNCVGAFKFVDINGNVEHFDLDGADFELDVNALIFDDRYGLQMRELWGHFAYTDSSMALTDFHLATARSTIDGDYRMDYDSIADMSDYIHKVRMTADFDASEIASADIQHFAPSFPDFEKIAFAGSANGTVADLNCSKLSIGLFDQTALRGNLYLRQAHNPDSLYLESDQIEINSSRGDLEQLMSLFGADSLPSTVDSLSNVGYAGKLEGSLRAFSLNGVVLSNLGEVQTQLKLDLSNGDEPLYKGRLISEGFQLGYLLQQEQLGLVRFDISLDGRGLDPAQMNTELKGRIDQLDFKGYSYSAIQVDGQIAEGRFDGDLNINDPNLKFDFTGFATFLGDTSQYVFTAQIKKADLRALNFVSDSISEITAALDIDLRAYQYEDWLGSLRLTDITYANEANFYFFEDIRAEAKPIPEGKSLNIESSIFSAQVQGEYSFPGLYSAFAAELGKFGLTSEPVEAPLGESFAFDFQIDNAKIITEIFLPKLEVNPRTRLQGNYSEQERHMDLSLRSSGITYDQYSIKDAAIDYDGGSSKSQLGLDIASFRYGEQLTIDSIKLGNFYYQDTLFFNLAAIVRDSVDSKAKITGYALQDEVGTFEFGVFESPFNYGYQNFTIEPGNRIYYDTSGVLIEDLRIRSGEKLIAVNGNISDKEHQILRINLRNFGMKLVNYALGSPEAQFKGKLHGDILLSQVLATPRIASDLFIDSLRMNNTELGNFSLTSDWRTESDTILLSAKMMLGELKTFEADGFYQADSTGNIDFDINFERFRLAALNPFLVGLAENMRGFVDGSIKVKGAVANPKIEGRLQLPKVAFTVSFLQTDYNLVGEPSVEFTQNEIIFPDLELRDSKYGTKGYLTGKVKHQQFRDFDLDLRIEAEELLVLNTPGTREDAYYGKAFASGEIRMKGPPSLLDITADLTSERETSFNIPLSGSSSAGQRPYISFVDLDNPDTTSEEQDRRLNLDKGINLKFDLTINQNARVSIILDERTGNQLSATGNGNIELDISRSGELELFGTYTIAEGNYDFNLQGFFNRDFQVEQGSSITFNGSPYDAVVDITAKYVTRADPSLLVSGYTGGRTLTEVYLNLDGALASPEITFDIVTPRAGPLVQAAVRNIGATDQKTEQVFSLLATNSFIPETGVSTGGSNLINGWDLLANQAASWFNAYSDRYNLTLNYQQDQSGQGQVLQNSQEELEVGLSTSFFDDRVTVNGSVGVPVGQNTNSVAGEAEIEYSITEDGRFRVKVFNRELDNQYISGNQYQQGVGLYYRLDFDNLSELWRKIVGTKEENPAEEPARKEQIPQASE